MIALTLLRKEGSPPRAQKRPYALLVLAAELKPVHKLSRTGRAIRCVKEARHAITPSSSCELFVPIPKQLEQLIFCLFH